LGVPLITALLLAATLFLLSILGHYEIIQVLHLIRKRWKLQHRVEFLLLVIITLPVHIVAIGAYALAYYFMHESAGLGSLQAVQGSFAATFIDFCYFSITCYTTLGFGDVYPLGPMRLVAALEGLNGLVLITLSASSAYTSATAMRDR